MGERSHPWSFPPMYPVDYTTNMPGKMFKMLQYCLEHFGVNQLHLMPAHWERIFVWNCELAQKLLTGAVMSPRRPYTLLTLQNGHIAKVHLHICVYTQRLLLMSAWAREASFVERDGNCRDSNQSEC